MAGQFVPAFPIYWEKQESALCGTHCLNNLLQGPYFSAVDMAGVAAALDERERALMRESGVDSAAFLAHMAADSSNVDDSGNYSIEVLSTCLQNLGFECVNIQNEHCASIRADMAAQQGFICNLHSHWFGLRRINGLWFNLNSLQAENDGWGPTYLSDFAFLALIDSLRSKRYSIFVVTSNTGSWPPADTDADVRGQGRWFDSREVVEATKSGFKKQKLAHGSNANNAQVERLMAPGGAAAGDRALAAALAMSMAQESRQSGGSETLPASLQDPNAYPGASVAGYSSSGSSISASGASGGFAAAGGAGSPSDFDDELARALAASLEDAQSLKRKSPGGVPAAAASGNGGATAPATAAATSSSTAGPATSASPAAAGSAVGGEQRNPAMSAREAAAAAALKRVAAANAASTQPASASPSPPAESAAAPPASAAEPANAAAPAATEPAQAGAVDDADDADEQEQLRLAMELSMQQPESEAAS